MKSNFKVKVTKSKDLAPKERPLHLFVGSLTLLTSHLFDGSLTLLTSNLFVGSLLCDNPVCDVILLNFSPKLFLQHASLGFHFIHL
jgi:hypothetical protein